MTIKRRDFIAASAAFASTLALPKIAGANDTIKLGSILDTSGIFDAYGKPMDMAMRLAVKEINEAGGLNGKQIEVVSYDTQSDMALYTQFGQQLVRRDKADVVHGGILSASREAIRQTMRKAKTLYFYNVLYEGGVCDRNIFINGVPDIKGAVDGPLRGKRIALKDTVCVAGVPMMNGSSIMEGYVPEINATIVTRILDAGGIVAGKTHCENLCISGGSHTNATGPVHNPWKHGYMAGGSSSGSAALVAAGEVDMAIAGDQGGSVRIPSSSCGVYGMKPTHGLVPYGMTETSPISFQSFIDEPIEKRVTTVGRIHPHLEVKIIDQEGAIVPVGEEGELCTRGYSVMRGYWGDAERTSESIVDGWMRTGDLATLDAEGYCAIVGRVKDMIIRGGENIYPAEIEDFLFSHPAVREAQVFGIPDSKLGEVVGAWIVPAEDMDLSAEEILGFCDGQIAHYKIPKHIRIVDSLPMTVTGKPQKFAMRDWMVENGFSE